MGIEVCWAEFLPCNYHRSVRGTGAHNFGEGSDCSRIGKSRRAAGEQVRAEPCQFALDVAMAPLRVLSSEGDNQLAEGAVGAGAARRGG